MLFWFYHASILSVCIKPHRGFWIHARQAGSQLNTCTDRQKDRRLQNVIPHWVFLASAAVFYPISHPVLPSVRLYPRLSSPARHLQRFSFGSADSPSSPSPLYTLSSLFWYYLNSPSHFLWVTLTLSLSLSLSLSHTLSAALSRSLILG